MMMSPERITVPEVFDTNDSLKIRKLADRILAGEVFVYPTETIYGIGGRYDDRTVYHRIISIKKRAPDNPMILLGASIEAFRSLNLQWTITAKKCAAAFWPGLLTMVLPSSSVPEGVAVRVSDHSVIATLGEYCSVPLFSTSANISGEPYDPDPDQIWESVGRQSDFMIDAGFLPSSQPSTVVRFSEDGSFSVLREGCISTDAVKLVAGDSP